MKEKVHEENIIFENFQNYNNEVIIPMLIPFKFQNFEGEIVSVTFIFILIFDEE